MWEFLRGRGESGAVVERTEPVLQAAPVPAVQNSVSVLDLMAAADVWLPGAPGVATPVVTPRTSMRVGAVYACARILAGVIACSRPIVRDASGNVVQDGVASLLTSRPNEHMSAAVFQECSFTDKLLGGDWISYIERDRRGVPVALHRHNPQAVGVELKAGRLKYSGTYADGRRVEWDQDDVLHVPGFGRWNHRGLSVIACGAQAVGLGMSIEEYAASFFQNDATPGGIISYPGKVSSDQADEIRAYWERRHSGPGSAHKPAVLSENGKFQPIQIPAADAQLIQQREFQVVDISRMFGVPPWMINSTEKTTSWGSGMVEQFMAFVRVTVLPHLIRIQQEIENKILPPGYTVEYDYKYLLRGDQKTRNEGHKMALGGGAAPGWMTPNEVRISEGLDTLPGGDALYVPSAASVQTTNGNGEDDQ